LKHNLKQQLIFISGDFFMVDLPQNRRFMLNYFKLKIQRQFLFYFYIFGSYRYFQEHTGYICSYRWLKKLKIKYIMLERVYDKLKKEYTESSLEKISLIEVGKLKYDYKLFKSILES
jgi:hypothetical protein